MAGRNQNNKFVAIGVPEAETSANLIFVRFETVQLYPGPKKTKCSGGLKSRISTLNPPLLTGLHKVGQCKGVRCGFTILIYAYTYLYIYIYINIYIYIYIHICV